jgi:hypothetical protein
MRLADLINRVERRAPFSTPEAARGVLIATLGVVGEGLPPQLARELFSVLPTDLDTSLSADREPRVQREEEFYLHVSRNGSSPGSAVNRLKRRKRGAPFVGP